MKRAAILALAVSCAHAPPPVFSTRDWPAPPARPLVRLVDSFPRAGEEPDPAPLWKRVLAFVAGLEPEGQTRLLERPFGVAAVEGGFVVADPDRPAVLRVRDGRSTALECAAHPWKAPLAVAAGPDGSLYVADGVVLRLTPAGACLAIGAEALERPSGLAFVAGRIYAVDPPRHRVVAFSPEGREVLRFGARGDGSGQLNFPTGLAAAPGDLLLVVDALNFRIVRYRADGSVVDSFGQPGDGGGAFGRPKGVTVDGRGRTFVSDAQHDVVIVFSAERSFDLAVDGALTLPAGVSAGDGFLYVADPWNHRVQIFRLLSEADR